MRHRLVPCLAALLVPAVGIWAADLPPMHLQPVQAPPPVSSSDQLVDDVIPAYGVTHQRPYRIRSRLNDLYHRIHVFTASTEAAVATGQLALPLGTHGESPETPVQHRVREYLSALDEEVGRHHLLNHYERWQLFTSYRNLHRINDLLTLGLGQELFAEMTKVADESLLEEAPPSAPEQPSEEDDSSDSEPAAPVEPSQDEAPVEEDTLAPSPAPVQEEESAPPAAPVQEEEAAPPATDAPATSAPGEDLADLDPEQPVATEDKSIEVDGPAQASVDHDVQPVEQRGPRGRTVVPWTVEAEQRSSRRTPVAETEPSPVEPSPEPAPQPEPEPAPEPSEPALPPSEPQPEPEVPAPPIEDEPVPPSDEEEEDEAEEEAPPAPARPAAPPPPALDEDALLDDLPPLD